MSYRKPLMPVRAIHASLASTLTTSDALVAAEYLFKPNAWREGDVRAEFRRALADLLPGVHLETLDSGRNALRLLLQELDIGRGDEVLLQSYTCVSVPGPVRWVGAEPIYVDIRPETYTMDPEDFRKKISPRSRAVIIQHTFGLPADLNELLAIARAHGLVVIEDCAHALGATYQGKPVGTFGDAAIFSFGRDKVISCVFGGALAVRDSVLAGKVGARADSPPTLPAGPPSGFTVLRNTVKSRGVWDVRLPPVPLWWIAQQLLHPVLALVARETYFAGGRYLLRAAQSARLLSKALTHKEKRGGEPPFPPSFLPNALAALAFFELTRLTEFTERRQALAKHYTESLAEFSGVTLPKIPPDRTHVFLRYAIRVADPPRLHAAARRAGIILGDWYDTVIAPRGADLHSVHYQPGSCPRAEEIARHTVNLPTAPVLGIPDTDRVLGVVRAHLLNQ